MGQSNQSSLSTDSELSKVFSIQDRVKQQNITYLEHLSTHKPYLLREQTFKEEAEQLNALAKLQLRKNFNSPHLTNLVKHQHSQHDDLCSKYQKVISLWEFPRRTLAEEINQRALAKRPFSQPQIKALLRNIAEGCLTLQQYRITHECLTSKTILIENSTHFRVVDPIALPIHPNLDLIYQKRSLKNLYLSPEQCRIIDQQDISKPVVDPYRQDVFTTAMIILEAGLLQRQDDCYEQQCAKINWRNLDFNLKRFEQNYGPQLKHYLSLMLTVETSHRIDWLQVREILGSVPALKKVEYIHRVPVPVQQTVIRQEPMTIRVQKPMRNSYLFSYHNSQPSSIPVNSNITYIRQSQPPPRLIAPPLTLTNSQRQPIPVTVSQRKQAYLSPGVLVSRTSPVKFLNDPNTTKSPSRSNQPSQFNENKDQPLYTIDQFKNGGRYQGYKVNGKRSGWGKYTYQDGGCYEGEWRNDLMCGKGKLYYQSGKIAYDGYLQNDLFHGTGTLYNQSPEVKNASFNFHNFQDIEELWISYQGQFRQDKKEGQGTLLLTNGEVLQGSFHDDKVQGQGTFTTMNGEKIRGVWHQNRFQRELS